MRLCFFMMRLREELVAIDAAVPYDERRPQGPRNIAVSTKSRTLGQCRHSLTLNAQIPFYPIFVAPPKFKIFEFCHYLGGETRLAGSPTPHRTKYRLSGVKCQSLLRTALAQNAEQTPTARIGQHFSDEPAWPWKNIGGGFSYALEKSCSLARYFDYRGKSRSSKAEFGRDCLLDLALSKMGVGKLNQRLHPSYSLAKHEPLQGSHFSLPTSCPSPLIS